MRIIAVFVIFFMFSSHFIAEEKEFDNSVFGMFLEDAKSGRKIFPDGKMKLIEIGGYRFNLKNKSGSEVFTAYFHEGNVTMCFSIFVVKKTPKVFKEPVIKIMKNIKKFKTGKGIILGMKRQQVIKILGEISN